jgi:hypothetical protein
MCIDVRGLDEVIRKDAYPLPRVDDTMDELNKANFLIHLGLALGFRRAREPEENVHKTAFQTFDGLTAMPFRLWNASATF